ncbi:ABC transporter ATP-binding protein [Desulfotomaculum sp. 1211_IL3151]|uniref:ABC transporter ATP-binding protein n=1 Tax=Desulfotomaculum sp. 1211_IL3151 TaxID=3084055 RepID=UPI002FDA72A3
MISIRELSKTFGSNQAVAKVSLEVQGGEIFGLVGPDGAGKSTLIRMICGLITPDSGSVVLSLPEPTPERGAFGYMPQKFSLYGDLSIMENINFFGSMYGLKQQTIGQRSEEILQLTNLLSFKTRLADQLSGGMKQKLALTCALISQPSLLVLDEPTYGVDPESRKEFWKILYRLNKSGMTILVSTPYMDEAELCQRVGFMNNGRLAAVDTPSNLKANFPYKVLEIKAASREPELFKDFKYVLDANFYGYKYQVVVEDAAMAVSEIRSFLTARAISLESIGEVAPTMENVFVSMEEGVV